jgi:hypothetical protein
MSKCSKCGGAFLATQTIQGHEHAVWHENCPVASAKHTPTPKPIESDVSEIACDKCGGTGYIENIVDQTPLKYGEHTIGKDWEKISNVWIWFEAFHKYKSWRGIPGYVFETPGGYLAPFRGELIAVVKDTKNEYREYKT